ncbi:MAG: ATP-binding protein, partial [Armatimonadota bacterium]
VDLFDDRLEVRSPGLLVPPVTLERLRAGERVHASRNPYIVRVLTDYGYMRDRGEGIPRIRHVMEEEGLKPPEFNVEGGCFIVTLYSAPVYSAETMRWLKQLDHEGLSRNQKRLLAYAYERGGRFTSRDYQRLTGLDKYTASRDIHDLVRWGVVRLEQPRGRQYFINLPVTKSVPMLAEPEELRRLKPRLHEQGYIQNEDIREVLQVSVDKATQIARRLVLAGWLEARGQKRGRRYYLKENSRIIATD